MLNPRAPTPLYRQLAQQLLGQVHEGALGEGARIPSEHELAERHGVARPTVRQATELLVRDGVLERRRGSGTFVRRAPAPVDLFSLSGTLAAFEGSGVTLTMRVVERARVRKVPPLPAQPFAGREALTVTRVGSADRVPVLLEQLFLQRDLFAGIEAGSVAKGSLSRWLQQTRGQAPVGGRQAFRVHAVSPKEAELLGVPKGSPLLLVLRTLDFAGAPSALYARMLCRTDRVELSQTLRADGSL